MSIKPAWANVELASGILHEDVRIVYADRIQFERTARAKGWRAEDSPTHAAGYLAWAALRRTNVLDEVTYEEFVDQLVDVQLTDVRPDTTGEVEPGDPSRAAH